MKQYVNRREFMRGLAISTAAAALPLSLHALKKRHVNIGHTGITWRNRDIEQAITDVSGLGFYGFETFGNVLDHWEEKPGGLGAVLKAHNLPLISAYCNFNLVDPARRQEQIDNGELPGLSSAEREELRAARLRIRALETELAVHRRAAELLKESVRPKGASRRSP